MPLATVSTRYLYGVLLVCLVHWDCCCAWPVSRSGSAARNRETQARLPKTAAADSPRRHSKVSSLGLSRRGSRSTSLCARRRTLWLGAELDRAMLCREVCRNIHWRLHANGNPRRQELLVRV